MEQGERERELFCSLLPREGEVEWRWNATARRTELNQPEWLGWIYEKKKKESAALSLGSGAEHGEPHWIFFSIYFQRLIQWREKTGAAPIILFFFFFPTVLLVQQAPSPFAPPPAQRLINHRRCWPQCNKRSPGYCYKWESPPAENLISL